MTSTRDVLAGILRRGERDDEQDVRLAELHAEEATLNRIADTLERILRLRREIALQPPIEEPLKLVKRPPARAAGGLG